PDERAFLAELEPARTVLVRTKADQVKLDAGEMDAQDDAPAVAVSALTGEGMAELRGVLLARGFGGIVGEPGEAPLVTRERHARGLRAARAELEHFLAALAEAVPMEFAATHLRAAAGALEDLVGAVTAEDVLDRVFGQFCVGK
ncbi:MAG TPA: hypothetical protein VFX98_02020, partial [Longimicrobiaceae bacterium]|nr:hypothetical protein [Longimicrobiaceae bacterium]